MIHFKLFHRRAMPALGLLTGLLICTGLYTGTHYVVENNARERFMFQTSNAQLAIGARVADYSSMLRGLGALFQASDDVSRQEFQRYAGALDLKDYPGLLNLSYSRIVSAARRPAFEAAVRADRSVDPGGYPSFAIHPPGQRASYHVLTYLEPLAGYQASFGYDMASDPTGATFLERLGDNNTLYASPRLIARNGKALGMVIRLPLYRAGMPLETLLQRRAAYAGTVGAGFNLDRVMDSLHGNATMRAMHFRLYDTGPVDAEPGSAAVQTLLYDSRADRSRGAAPARAVATPAPQAERFTTSIAWEIGGRRWESRFNATGDEMLGRIDRLLPWLSMAAGMVVCMLLFFVVPALTVSRRQALEMAQLMNRDLLHAALHDSLTGLPNRRMFHQSLTAALERNARVACGVAVLFIDLDRFKQVNDTVGHFSGDEVLRQCARRLTAGLDASCTVARLGGDEFAIIVEGFDKIGDITAIASGALAALEKPFIVDGQEFLLAASIGISTASDATETGGAGPARGAREATQGRYAQEAVALLKNADAAMYKAKAIGNNYQFYSAQMNAHHLARFVMETSLRHAVERDELLLHYQPKLDLRTNQITGLEALVRWQHPEMGLVPPGQFIALAEESGLIIEIGLWVLQAACRQMRVWQDAGFDEMRVAVNLSTRQFNHGDLLRDITDTLERTGIEPRFLEIEITESMVMDNASHAIRLLGELKKMGIHLSIDDFGIGHSSLAYLRRLPVHCVKIDRAFVKDIPFEADDMAISKGIIGLGHSLRLRVLAEGVETMEQMQFLKEQGCDEIQGYLFGKPLPADETLLFLKNNKHGFLMTA